MIKTSYLCDLCNKENEYSEEFKNEIILVGNENGKQINQISFKVCPTCLEQTTQHILKTRVVFGPPIIGSLEEKLEHEAFINSNN